MQTKGETIHPTFFYIFWFALFFFDVLPRKKWFVTSSRNLDSYHIVVVQICLETLFSPAPKVRHLFPSLIVLL
jgi:hypothetical protein